MSFRFRLVPIDHGLILPDVIDVATFDLVWFEWPHCKVRETPPSSPPRSLAGRFLLLSSLGSQRRFVSCLFSHFERGLAVRFVTLRFDSSMELKTGLRASLTLAPVWIRRGLHIQRR